LSKAVPTRLEHFSGLLGTKHSSLFNLRVIDEEKELCNIDTRGQSDKTFYGRKFKFFVIT
jgi:hypothetical protein